MPKQNDENADLVRSLFAVVLKMIRAGNDRTLQEEALREAREALAEEIEKRRKKFTDEEPPT